MVYDHVAQSTDRVVEMAAILDSKALSHRDLDRGHELRFQTGSSITFAKRRYRISWRPILPR